MNDSSAARAIAEALGDLSERTVVEIGPGRGAITGLLAARAKRLIAVEVDPLLAERLVHDYAAKEERSEERVPEKRIEVLQQDVLTVDLSALRQPGESKLAVVGNLPYYITSPILLHLFAHYDAIDQAVIMVQREVADRVAAEPGSRDYGLLTATTLLYANVEKLFTLPPEAFSPPPKVHSTVMRLTFGPKYRELRMDPGQFVPFLRQIFAQKRKTLMNNLRFAGWSGEQIVDAFRRVGISPGLRAEALPLEAAAEIFHELTAREEHSGIRH